MIPNIYLAVDNMDRVVGFYTELLKRKLPWDFLIELGMALTNFLPGGTIFIRFDLPWGQAGGGNLPEPLDSSGGLKKAAMDIQPPSTVLIDLKPTEDEILAAMKTKTRYNIRLASKGGVDVVDGRPEDLKDWYAIYRETAERDRITLHGQKEATSFGGGL